MNEIKEIKRMSDIHKYHSDNPEFGKSALVKKFGQATINRYWKRYVTKRIVHDIKPFDLQDFRKVMEDETENN